MAADRTAISAVQDLQKQFDLAFGTQQPSSHLAHPLNDNTVPVLASSLCARLTSGLGELDAALNASTATSAASKAVSGLVDFSNELFQAKQLDQARMSLNFDTHRYKLPRQNLGTALQLFSKSCGFDLFSEGEIVTLGGQVCVLDFHLSSDKSTASKTHFTYGAEGHTDEQMDQMLFALTNAQDLNALWSALRDIKQLDHMAVSQSDIFTNVKDACQKLENVGDLQPLTYQSSPYPSFLLHMPPIKRLDSCLGKGTQPPGTLSPHLEDASVAKLHLNPGSATHTLHLDPPIAFGQRSGQQMMQALGKLDIPFATSTQQGRPVMMEDLLTAANLNKIVRYDPQDRFRHELPDCKPIIFSLGNAGSERGFLLTSLTIDTFEQLTPVLEILRRQTQLNALFRSAFDPNCKVERETVDEDDMLFQPQQESSRVDPDLLTDPTKIGAEVHWTEGGLAVMLPFKSDAEELDLHILEVACLRDQGVFLDEEAHSKLKQVVELSSSLPMAVRWLLRSRNGS